MGKIINSAYEGIIKLISINFDFVRMLSFKFDFFYLPSNMMMIAMIMSVAVTITAIYIARKISKDNGKIVVPFLLSILFYAPLFAMWWFTSFLYKIRRKTLKWNGVSWKKD